MKAVAGGAIAMRIPIINPLLRCFLGRELVEHAPS
jgi:hypothetical protein